MAVKQIAESFQNDGNFCSLDLKDVAFNKPTMRIETFRSSQPEGIFGVTKPGTSALHLCGMDHLSKNSGRIFRHIFSVQDDLEMKVTLEIRELFDENGSWHLTVRDVDYKSKSFGTSIDIKITPVSETGYKLGFEIMHANMPTSKILSPLTDSISAISSLKDIALLGSDPMDVIFKDEITLNLFDSVEEVNSKMNAVREFSQMFTTWVANIKVYQRFGDFRDKCIHNGTNLTGPNPALASEFVIIRAYRSSLTFIGAIFDNEMYEFAGDTILDKPCPILYDPKPGVYTPFLNAFMLNIGIYKLGLDKVHSDYGGVPMKLSPGSRLENGATPVINSMRANETIADLAALFFQPQLLPLKLKFVNS